jgi:hypothetical protein
MALMPTEAYSPLIVDTYAVLAESVSGEFLQTIAGWNTEILKRLGGVKDQQFPKSCSLN